MLNAKVSFQKKNICCRIFSNISLCYSLIGELDGWAGDGNGAGVGAGAKVEGSEGALALALRDPKNVMVGSSGFQQLFLM